MNKSTILSKTHLIMLNVTKLFDIFLRKKSNICEKTTEPIA